MVSSQPNMEKYLREWRQDALNKAQYDAAIFVGDKLFAMTGDDGDAFWLAQVYFAAGRYTRAQDLLTRQDLATQTPSCRYLAAHCLIKQHRFDEALSLLGEHNPTHLIHGNAKRFRSRTGGASSSRNGPREREEAEEAVRRRFEASMCYLRGLCYSKKSAYERAKECYKDAVRIDVQCFEAFSELTRNSLLSVDEEDEFMASLDFSSIPAKGDDPDMEEEPADYTQMLYTTQLSKARDPAGFNTAVESLTTHYGLADNPDILIARGQQLYVQCRFKEALAITHDILTDDKHNFSAYPLHLACLYELKMKNQLFLIAHELADSFHDEPCTYLAIAIYYFSVDRIAEARRFFSKASMMDSNYGPAWIGFAHTFAAEGEHDQAISAYSTAARLFQGTHLPQVFLGMQHHAMNNMSAAEEFLKEAYTLCKSDPLLLNEMGIVYYHQDKLKEAAQAFKYALKVADDINSDSVAWIGTRTNLGHALRRLKLYDEALEQFDKVLREGGKDSAIFSAKALIHLHLGQPDEAAHVLHQALAIHPQDPIATDLLDKALNESYALNMASMKDDLLDFEAEMVRKKAEANAQVTNRIRRLDRNKKSAKSGVTRGKDRAGAKESDGVGSGGPARSRFRPRPRTTRSVRFVADGGEEEEAVMEMTGPD